jgi:hypothetical protein
MATKNIYEVFDEFEEQRTHEGRMNVIGKNLSPTLVEVLKMTFHPDYQWKISELPTDYKLPTDQLPGLTYDNISNKIKKLYMFREGDPTANSLNQKKQNELLIQMLESLEPRDAEVIMGIFNKNQGVKGLDYKFVKQAFPKMLP